MADVVYPPVEEWPPGPGTVLRVRFAAAGFPSCQQCLQLAWQMNEWGPAGCRERLDAIVADILPRARQWTARKFRQASRLFRGIGIEGAMLTAAIRVVVLQAIAESEAPPC